MGSLVPDGVADFCLALYGEVFKITAVTVVAVVVLTLEWCLKTFITVMFFRPNDVSLRNTITFDILGNESSSGVDQTLFFITVLVVIVIYGITALHVILVIWKCVNYVLETRFVC